MIPYKVIEPFVIGPLHINFYGIFFAIGILVAILLSIYYGKKEGFSKEIIEDLSIYLILGIIIGARLFYVLFFWPQNLPLTFLDIFKVYNGGMAFFGGFIGAFLVGYLFCKKHKLDFFKLLDVFTIPIIVGHILGRVGGYLIGNHPGTITNSNYIFAIYLDGAFRHPVELYDLVGLIIILLIIFIIKNKFKKLKKGVLFAIYIILYGVQRLFIDLFRTAKTDPRFFGLTPSQIIIIFLLIISIYYIFKIYKNKIGKI